jgi:hypothetical protein
MIFRSTPRWGFNSGFMAEAALPWLSHSTGCFHLDSIANSDRDPVSHGGRARHSVRTGLGSGTCGGAHKVMRPFPLLLEH